MFHHTIIVYFLFLCPLFFFCEGIGTSPLFAAPADSVGIEHRDNRVYILYQVEPHEKVEDIASHYGASPAAVRMINHLRTHEQPYVGQVIRIPRPKAHLQNRGIPKEKRIYKVKDGDNLYKIARQFSMKVVRLRELNQDQLKDDFISKGQALWVEIPKNRPQLHMLPPTENHAQTTQKNSRQPIVHKISKDETLFGISKKRNISLDSLRYWNKLKNDNIGAGDSLIVGYRKTAAPSGKSPIKKPPTPKNDRPQKNMPKYHIEKGICKAIPEGKEEPVGKTKLALHTKASVGSYMRVENPNTRKSIFVKVIGQLSEADMKENVIVKMNKAACDALGAVNKKFPVEVAFFY